MLVYTLIYVEMECEKEVYLFIRKRKEDWEVLEFAEMTELMTEERRTFAYLFEDCLKELETVMVQGCGRSKNMSCYWADATPCLPHGPS